MRHALVAASMSILFAHPALAKKVTIKLGTMAPSGSTWHLLLKEMGARWAEASDGRVKLKVYAGGVAGNEADMMRKMRIGQLHAAAFTSLGLTQFTRAPQAISVPGVIADEEEWTHVFAEMQPLWNAEVEANGYVVLGWGDLGWVYMVVNKEVRSPVEMNGLKVFAWAGDPAAVESWRLAGFQPVVLSGTDVMQGLSTGMIEAFAATPMIAMTARWYERAPYMVKTAWGHLPGATIVSKKVWDRIPAEMRGQLAAIARDTSARVNAEVLRMQGEAIAAMKKRGLTLIELDEAGQRAWGEMAEKAWPAIRGGVVSEADFDRVIEVRDAYRASHEK